MRVACVRATFRLSICLWSLAAAAEAGPPAIGQATGIRIGEVTSQTAVIWTRTTTATGSGAAGSVRVSWRPANASPASAGGATPWRSTGWLPTDPRRDFTRQVPLEGLAPGSAYALRVESRVAGGGDGLAAGQTLRGGFSTAPAAREPTDIRFTVVTGQRYGTRDAGDRGHRVYESMRALGPSFFVHTGDVVYYDKPRPYAKDVMLARAKWARMYSLPLQRDFHLQTASYFLKDDHDTLKDDCWPGQRYGRLTWAQGVALFREQTPAPERPYRTVRWGRDLQIWLLEGREFRSPNDQPDGPDKTILGGEQLAWLEGSLGESDATFKVVISATPIVGPDRSKKRDNHANEAFRHEGDRLRAILAGAPNVRVVCGDRHWQYASVDPATGLREYCCGPTTDAHSGGWGKRNVIPGVHRFLRVRGGFLSVAVDRPAGVPRIAFRHHAVDGTVVNEEAFPPG